MKRIKTASAVLKLNPFSVQYTLRFSSVIQSIFCIYGGGLWQHHQRPNALPICKPQPLFICICLVLYSNSLIAPPSVCHRNRMILRVLLFFGVSGSISIGYTVQGLKPGWSSSKNPPIWQHIGFSSHPSPSQ